MKKFTCCFILLLSSFYMYAQSSQKLDSLKKVLAKLPKEGASFAGDTMRVQLLVTMGLYINDSTAAFANIDKAEKLLSKIKWKKGEGILLNHKGYLLLREGYQYHGIDELYAALKIGEELNSDELLSFSNRYLGAAYYVLDDDKQAINFYQKAAAVYKKNQSKFYLKSYAVMLSNIGLSYTRLKKYNEAISCYKTAIQKSSTLKDSLTLAWFYSNLGTAYRENNDLQNSLINYDISLKLFGNQNSSEKGFTLSEKAITLLRMNKNTEALKVALSAEMMCKTAKPFVNLFVLEALYKAYKANKNDKMALKTHEKWFEVKNTNDNELKKKSIEGIKNSFENKKKEVEISQQKFQYKILLIGLIGTSILGMVIFGNYIILRKKNAKIEIQKQEINKINTELESFNKVLEDKVLERTSELQKAYNDIKDAMTKGQTIERKRVASELHDNLGSMLSGMKWRLQVLNKENLSEKEQKVYEGILLMMSNAYSEVRLISHNLLPIELEKHGLIGALKVLINDINLSENINVVLKYDDEICFKKNIELELYAVCMEIFNNILKHSQAQNVVISFSQTIDESKIIFSDDGIGFDIQAIESTKSMGIKNIKNRLNSINANIQFLQLDKAGTKIILNLPN